MLLKRGSLFHLQLQMMADVRKSLSMRRLGRLKCWFKDNHLQLQMMADVKKNLVAAYVPYVSDLCFCLPRQQFPV